MVRVISALARKQHKSGELRMSEFPMAAFAALNANKSGCLQFGNQLANLSWHTSKHASLP